MKCRCCKTMNIRQLVGFMLLPLLLLPSCERRDLEDAIGDTVKVRTDIDWMSRFGKVPTGMTFGLYNAHTGGMVKQEESNFVTRYSLASQVGDYQMLIFNMTANELNMFDFSLSNYNDASVKLRPLTNRVPEEWDAGIDFSQAAEPLGVATDTIAITDDMLLGSVRFEPHPRTRSMVVEEPDTTWVFTETPQDETTLLSVRVRVPGIRSMGLVEGAVSGMAAEYLLGQRATTSRETTHLLAKAEWTAFYDEDDTDNGWISTDIRVLGLPEIPVRSVVDRDSMLNHLTLDFLLIDGKTHFRFDRNVGDLMRYADTRYVRDETTGELRRENYYVDYPTHHLYLVVSTPPLPDLPPVDIGASGFSAEVSPWQKGEIIDVDM